jgi:hypothetical protein
MPIRYHIDPTRRLVIASGHGRLTDQDVFGYQREVWSRAEVAGFDELVDMTEVERIDIPSSARLKELATLAAGMDLPHQSSRFAIVATDEVAMELARFFGIYRELDPRSTKQVSLFKTRAAALDWLGVGSPAE